MHALEKARSKKKKRSRDGESSDEEEDDNNAGLLVVKQVHEWGDKSEPLPDVHLNEASKSRHVKKIRVDGSSSGTNQKIVFNDDGDVEDDMIHEENMDAAEEGIAESSGNELASAREEYLQKVRSRLSKTKELDRKEARERVQEKHRKRKMKEKGVDDANNKSEDGDDEGAVVTLGGQYSDESDDDGQASGSSSSDSIEGIVEKKEDINLYESSDEDSDNDDEDDEVDVKAQEELALAMLGK